MTDSIPIPTIALNTGTSVRQLGLGTWPLNDEEAADAVVAAAEAGYRYFDTATRYGNEWWVPGDHSARYRPSTSMKWSSRSAHDGPAHLAVSSREPLLRGAGEGRVPPRR